MRINEKVYLQDSGSNFLTIMSLIIIHSAKKKVNTFSRSDFIYKTVIRCNELYTKLKEISFSFSQ